MLASRSLKPAGTLGLNVVRGNPFDGATPWSWRSIWTHAFPHRGLPLDVNVWRRENLPHVLWGAIKLRATLAVAKLTGVPVFASVLFVRVKRSGDYLWHPLGIGSFRVVTTAGVNYLASCFDNTAEPELFKFHAYGTGTTAEAIGDTTLVTEVTTTVYVGDVRPTGSQAHATNTYTTVATFSPDSGGVVAITEHGLLSANVAGTLWDRSKFAAVNLDPANGDSLQTTYILTLTAGG